MKFADIETRGALKNGPHLAPGATEFRDEARRFVEVESHHGNTTVAVQKSARHGETFVEKVTADPSRPKGIGSMLDS